MVRRVRARNSYLTIFIRPSVDFAIILSSFMQMRMREVFSGLAFEVDRMSATISIPKIDREYATPIDDRVLVKVRQQEQVIKGVIKVVDTAPVLPIDGIVIAIGNDPEIPVKPGDRVCFGKYAGVEIRLNHEDHLIMFADEIQGIVE